MQRESAVCKGKHEHSSQYQANPRKSGSVNRVPSQNTDMTTADTGSTLPMMLPFKGPIMLTP